MTREAALQKQLEIAQHITHVGSWQWDVGGDRVLWSDELYRIYGLEPQSCEITFDTFLARVHPDDRERTAREVRAAIATGGRFAYPERIVRPDGSIRELETAGEAVLDGSQAVLGLVGTCRDVTEERALGAQVRLYADIFVNIQTALAVFEVGKPGEPNTYKLVAFNPAAEQLARMALGERVGTALPDILPYARGGGLERLLGAVARDGGVHETIVERSNDPRDRTRAVAMKAFPLPDGRIGLSAEDITKPTRARLLRDGEQRVLEQIAAGEEIADILEAITLLVEDHARPAIASVLLVGEDGRTLRHGSAPHLPPEYIQAIDGSPIGERAGSCGTAVYRRAPVYVTDIANDPLWHDYAELARRFELRACWSTPIIARDGRVLGTFALYYGEPRAPTDDDVALVARAGEIAGIALQRHQLEQQLRDLTAHADETREEERIGIARELHDVLGQALTALKLDVSWIARHAEGGVTRDALADRTRAMSVLVDEIIAATRRISSDLRPGLLDTLGLFAAFEWQAEEFSGRTGIPCEVVSNIENVKVERRTSTALFRILQEALTNVARHAQASRVRVKLEREGDALRLEIRDDGCGVTVERTDSPHALGLLGIRERARRLGGFAVIAGEAGKGTLVSVTLPFREAPP